MTAVQIVVVVVVVFVVCFVDALAFVDESPTDDVDA
jgi:hypothetical protein